MALKSLPFWQQFIPKSYLILKENYSWSWFKGDLFAGITVGVVALPLALGFAIASGVDPAKGIYTAIIAGFLTSLLGGSRFQVGGPTGAFVVILYRITQQDGQESLILAGLLAGIILLITGFLRLGTLVKFVPYPLVIGFTAGIGVMIFSLQIKDFFGLQIPNPPTEFFAQWKTLWGAFPSLNWITLQLSIGTLLLIFLIRKFLPIIPWVIASVVIGTAISYGMHLPVETIVSYFGELPHSLSPPSFPSFSNVHWDSVFTNGVTIAFVAGVESLLTAVMTDGMTGTRHKSNCELMAQGVSNIASVLFGGIAATGTIARSAINIKAGAKTPVSGLIHSVVLLFILWFLIPLVDLIPLAVLAAILMTVAWDMCEAHRFFHLFKAPRGDVIILLLSFILTIVFDLTVAIGVGVLLSGCLFIKKMMDQSGIISHAAMQEESGKDLKPITLPHGVEVYDIFGPFFFGVTDHLKAVLSGLEYPSKIFILRMHQVPFIDASGMQALKEFFYECKAEHTLLFLSGVNKHNLKSLKEFELVKLLGKENIFPRFDEALHKAKEHLRT